MSWKTVGDSLKLPAFWLIFAIAGIFLAFQIHATLIAIGYWAVQAPDVGVAGWNTYTIRGLSRFLYLIMGGLWLFWVSILPTLLRDWLTEEKWWRHLLWVGVGYAGIYLCNTITVLIFTPFS
jgi:hypothetical protein